MTLYSPIQLIRHSLVRHYIKAFSALTTRIFPTPAYYQKDFEPSRKTITVIFFSRYAALQWQQAVSIFLCIMQPLKQHPLLGVGDLQQLTACHTTQPTPENLMNWDNQITCMGNQLAIMAQSILWHVKAWSLAANSSSSASDTGCYSSLKKRWLQRQTLKRVR